MGFHRLTVPTYYGGLPGGYDYINNAISGTPAPADGAKSSGVNLGTYFVAFGEDATSANTNRANAALAENCDTLDDLFQTSQVVMRYDNYLIAAPTDKTNLVGDVYVGGNAETPPVVDDQETRNRTVRILDQYGNDLVINGTKVVAVVIGDSALVNQVGVPADGFFTNPRVQWNVVLPADAYKLYYLVRRNLSDIIRNKPAEFLAEQVRTVADGASAHSLIQFTDVRLNGLDDRYRRASIHSSLPPSAWPGDAPEADSAGSGAWFVKDSYSITGFIQRTSSGPKQGTLDSQDFLFGASFASRLDVALSDWGYPSDNSYRCAMGSGFVHIGYAATQIDDFNTSDKGPGFFGLGHFSSRQQNTSPSSDLTILEVGTTVSLSADQVTLSGNNVFYKNISGDKSAYVKGIDILVLVDGSDNYYYLTVTAFTSATVGTVRFLDGSHPNLSGTFTIVEWITPLCYSAEGAVSLYSGLGLSNTLPPQHAGFLFAEPPRLFSSGTDMSPRRYMRLFACDQDSASKTVAWGGYDQTSPTGTGASYMENGYLTADGGGQFGGGIFANAPGSSSAFNDTVAVLNTTVAPVLYKLLWEMATAIADKKVRLYVGDDGTLFHTVNARFGGSTAFYRDVTGPASEVITNASGAVFRLTAPSDAAGSVITWEATQNVTKYTLENISLTSATSGWSNGTTTPTVVTGLSTTLSSLKVGDLVKIRAEGSFDKGGNTNGAQLYLAQGGTQIADSLRWLGTEDQVHVVSISTQFEVTVDGALTIALYGSLLVGSLDLIELVTAGSLQIEVLRPG